MEKIFRQKTVQVLNRLGISEINNGASTGTEWIDTNSALKSSVSPIDGGVIAKVKSASVEDYELIMKKAGEAFNSWRKIPAPQRGEVVRQIGLALRKFKDDLGYLVSLEMGKILQEGKGEVQEMIDICDFAVGQSRQLYGFTMQSERKDHRMYDQYHPLGIVGLITSFNFPVAVWAWNSMIAAIAGDVVVWKPSSKTPLTAIATHNIIQKVLKENDVPEGVFNLVVAGSSVLGDNFAADKRIPLISVTGSTAVGKRVGKIVGERLGRVIQELGGNNAIIISQHADLEMAIPAIVFGAVGTAGQRCTTTRRLIIHESIYDEVKKRLVNAYKQVAKKIGNPLDEYYLVGPMIDTTAVNVMQDAIKAILVEGGKLIFGGEILKGEGFESGTYVTPAIAEAENHFRIVQEETFAPLVYLMKYNTIEEAIDFHNDVPQGLSSAIFTLDMREAELFLSRTGESMGFQIPSLLWKTLCGARRQKISFRGQPHCLP